MKAGFPAFVGIAVQLCTIASAVSAEKEKGIKIDTLRCEQQTAGFAWALGSVQVKVQGQKSKNCIFEYTEEIEGGYTTYLCSVSVTDGVIAVYPISSRDTDYGTRHGVKTSFSLEGCKKKVSGNVFFEDKKR